MNEKVLVEKTILLPASVWFALRCHILREKDGAISRALRPIGQEIEDAVNSVMKREGFMVFDNTNIGVSFVRAWWDLFLACEGRFKDYPQKSGSVSSHHDPFLGFVFDEIKRQLELPSQQPEAGHGREATVAHALLAG